MAEVRSEGRQCVLIVFADAITEHGMDGEYVSLPYNLWPLSSVLLAVAVAFGKCVGGEQE